MAHPFYQDPEPFEAKRRRKRLAQQAVQGKCLTYFNFTLADAVHMTLSGDVLIAIKFIVSLLEGSSVLLHAAPLSTITSGLLHTSV